MCLIKRHGYKIADGIIIILLVILLIVATSDHPPTYFEDHGACPYEGCDYDGEWVALKDVVVRSDIDSNTRALFKVKKGEVVTTVTGVVITHRPGRIKISNPSVRSISGISLKPDDILYIYTYLGEGISRIWFKGKMYEEDTYFEGSQELEQAESTWWIKIRNSSGQEGWAEKKGNFREEKFILYDNNATFEKIVRDQSTSLAQKLKSIDEMTTVDFDLNNDGTKHGSSPMDVIIHHGTPELATALLERGLNIDSSVRQCGDQYQYQQSGLLRPGGLAVLNVLVKAGFNENCMKNDLEYADGIVCGVDNGIGTVEYDVNSAVRAIEYLALHGFNVHAKCFGKTILERFENEKNPDIRNRLAPVVKAVRKSIVH